MKTTVLSLAILLLAMYSFFDAYGNGCKASGCWNNDAHFQGYLILIINSI